MELFARATLRKSKVQVRPARVVGILSVTLLAPVFAAIIGGCSGGDLGARVAGRVTLDDQPIGPGFLVFAPAGEKSNPANGAIQADGTYALKTINTAGLQPGKYRVSVTVLDQPNVPPGERSMVVAKLRIPEKYTSVESSGLEYEVEPGRNTIDIKLSSSDAGGQAL